MYTIIENNIIGHMGGGGGVWRCPCKNMSHMQ